MKTIDKQCDAHVKQLQNTFRRDVKRRRTAFAMGEERCTPSARELGLFTARNPAIGEVLSKT